MEWLAKFITYQDDFKNAPVFKKTFDLKKEIIKAEVSLCGLGVFEMQINGQKADDAVVLEPAFTDYNKRLLYCKYDVSKLLKQSNVIHITLGRGFYSMETENVWGFEKAPWKDKQKLIFQLEIEYQDHEIEYIISDESWLVAPSATTYDCFYVGECYDSRIEGMEEYKQAVIAAQPSGVLEQQDMESMRVIKKINPVDVFTSGNITVFDFGMIYTGFVEIEIEGESGREIELLYEERYSYENRKLSNNINAVIQVDKVICNGQKIKWRDRFSYKSFRFVEISNLPENYRVVAVQVNNDVRKQGSFCCDNEVLNWIYEATNNTILRNLHGIPTDTPVYEKNGWTGDAYLISEFAMKTFDMKKFLAKWLNDIADSQQENGEIPPIVPTPGWGTENCDYGWEAVRGPVPAWDIAYVILPLYFYGIYGDAIPLKNHYNNIKAYVDYLSDKTEGDIFRGGLGDWLPPLGEADGNCKEPQTEGTEIISTIYYCYILKLMSISSDILGCDEDRDYYLCEFERVRKIINDKYFDKEKKIYATEGCIEYRQTPNVLAVAFDIAEKENYQYIVKSIVADIKARNNHLNCGILGTRYLPKVLIENGYGDLAIEVLTVKDYPGFGFWMESGYKTLLESWETNARSCCHYMFGGLATLFYDFLCGIKSEAPGYMSVNISPFVPRRLNYCEGTVETKKGSIKVCWERVKDKVKYVIDIPEGIQATFGDKKIIMNEGVNTFII